MLLVNILINLLIVALVLWLIIYLVGYLVPQFTQPARVVCGVIFLIFVIYALAAILGGAPFHGAYLLR